MEHEGLLCPLGISMDSIPIQLNPVHTFEFQDAF